MTYRGSEVYLSARKYFVGAIDGSSSASSNTAAATTAASTHGGCDSGAPTICVPPGEHVYNFTCALPVNLPTSFEGTFGHIRYRAEVTVNVPLWPDKTFAEGFTVIRSLDLNGLSDVRVSFSGGGGPATMPTVLRLTTILSLKTSCVVYTRQIYQHKTTA